jgi:hypothetical protein
VIFNPLLTLVKTLEVASPQMFEFTGSAPNTRQLLRVFLPTSRFNFSLNINGYSRQN